MQLERKSLSPGTRHGRRADRASQHSQHGTRTVRFFSLCEYGCLQKLNLLCFPSAKSIWSFVLANIAIALGFAALALHVWATRKPVKPEPLGTNADDLMVANGFAGKSSRYLRKVGGATVFVYKAIRLSSIIALFALICVTSVQHGWSQLNIVLAEALVCLPGSLPMSIGN